MKIMTKKEIEVISDIRCDVCEESCQTEGDVSNIEFGTLSAHWGYGTQHDGESYEVHLCESCFFQAIANLKEQRRGALMFSEKGYEPVADFGLINRHLELI
ncbi:MULTISPECIES: hypothetical protein [Aeromonas]|uniref:hypothetical protein n=1 Tax=Aeromonas TaxID=642 RepID=UPI000FBFD00E|nr:hypothetical protein [Aeromonas caviae]MBL0577703.1 hypothetical protein [Aeromonas caviae]